MDDVTEAQIEQIRKLVEMDLDDKIRDLEKAQLRIERFKDLFSFVKAALKDAGRHETVVFLEARMAKL
jgi:hypothetical protein